MAQPGDRFGGQHVEFEGAGGSIGARPNWLRAGVLGANDSIVSVAGVVPLAWPERSPWRRAGNLA